MSGYLASRVEVQVLASLTLAIALVAATDGRPPSDDERAVLQVAEELRKAIVAQDVAGILALTHSLGVSCDDDVIPKSDFGRCLRSPGNRFHDAFFDTKKLQEVTQSTDPVLSVRDFFLTAKGLRKKTVDPFAGMPAEGKSLLVIWEADSPANVYVGFSFSREKTGEWRMAAPPDC